VPNVYKITYPNGKVYVGQDRLDQITYIESIANDQFRADFPPELEHDFTVRKETLWESDTADVEEATRIELEWIRRLRSNDPAVGYNRWPPLDARRS
jgi:hypothetical protein